MRCVFDDVYVCNSINRAMYVECTRRCPVGDRCKNQRLARRQYAKTAVVMVRTDIKRRVHAHAQPGQTHVHVHRLCWGDNPLRPLFCRDSVRACENSPL